MKRPIVIAHRGASGHRPEHTLEAYRLGAEMGADYIEPDLVITRDGVLIARHENEISGTTDVTTRAEFADRRTTKVIDGRAVTGWFAEDFTLEEVKTLRARERIPDIRPANVEYDDRFEIPTFDEVLALRAELGVGVYPETKHPSYLRSIGLPLEGPLLAALEHHPAAPVFIQSFEAGNLRELAARTTAPLVQLLREPADEADLRAIAAYAAAIGPDKRLVTPALIAAAHAAGLDVHPYTYRREPAFLLPGFADLEAELRSAFAMGVDGVFTDNPEIAVAMLG